MSSRALRKARKESQIELSLNLNEEEEVEIIENKPRKNNLFQQVIYNLIFFIHLYLYMVIN